MDAESLTTMSSITTRGRYYDARRLPTSSSHTCKHQLFVLETLTLNLQALLNALEELPDLTLRTPIFFR
jgi:hypothetical protein